MSVWSRKRFGIAQRHRRQLSFQEAYHVRDPESSQDILWAKRKRIGLKTDISIWESEGMEESNIALIVKDEAILDAFGKFSVIDPKTGQILAILKRHFLRSLIREKWTIRDPNTGEEIVTAQARSLLVSMIRNFRWIPPLSLFDFFLQFIRLQWDFYHKKDRKKRIGFFDRKFSIRDNYVLDFDADDQNILDPRVAVALGLLLDSAESR